MSVRQGLLAMLVEGPMYGARLRAEFERRTGGTWPLNVGQVYTTLTRLQRDGLVVDAGADDEGRIAYRLTDAGRAEVGRWWTTAVDHTADPRDELAIKLALAVTTPDVDVLGVVQAQRTATLRHLQSLTRLKRTAGDRDDLAWQLVLEKLVFGAEAEVRWLDHVESRVLREARAPRPASAPGEPGEPGDSSPIGTRADAEASR